MLESILAFSDCQLLPSSLGNPRQWHCCKRARARSRFVAAATLYALPVVEGRRTL